jgi:RecG-like helicase
MRGPGEFIGQNQAGFPEFHHANLFDFALMTEVRSVADALAAETLSPELGRLLKTPATVHME